GREYAAYVPVGEAVAKLRRWQDAGAVVDYLSSHRNPDEVALDALVLRTHGFPAGRVFAGRPGETYGDIAGREAPAVLIEDDCESMPTRSPTHRYRPPRGPVSSRSSFPSSAGSTTSPPTPKPCFAGSALLSPLLPKPLD